MSQLDHDILVHGSDRKIACETMATISDDPPHHQQPDFPVESFYLPKEHELEWFSRNAFYERKESTKGNNSNSNTPNSCQNSQRSQRISMNLNSSKPSSIIGLPKTQENRFHITKGGNGNGKPMSVRFFPKRTQSSNRVTEPSSPKVSCIGRVRSKRDGKGTRSDECSAGGFWSSWFFYGGGCCRRDAVDVDDKVAGLSPRKPVEKLKLDDRGGPVETPALGGMNRFVSGRRSDSWAGDLDSVEVVI